MTSLELALDGVTRVSVMSSVKLEQGEHSAVMRIHRAYEISV